MRNIRLAEWILGLVIASDRAASTAGDLAEEKAIRGPVWFWCAVLRTAASHVCRGVAETPTRVVGLAFLGAVFGLMLEFLFAWESGAVFFWMSLHRIHWNLFWMVLLETPSLIASFLIGRILARWAVNREVAVGLVYVILAPACGLFIDPPAGVSVFAAAGVVLGGAALQTPALAGAIWGRRRRLAA